MPSLQPMETAFRAAHFAALLLAAAAAACGSGGDAQQGAAYVAGLDDAGDTPARIDVEPCSLLTNAEISEQLFLSLPASERASWTTSEFELATTEPELGVTRQCEYRFESRETVGGGPVWHSDFDVMVFPSNAIALAEGDRKPITGAGPEMFKEPGPQAAYYVVKGNLVARLNGFPGRREEESDRDAGRLVLLRHIAGRLP